MMGSPTEGRPVSQTPANVVRAGLDHPVIDADGHIIEFMPAVLDHLTEVGGREIAAAYEQVLNVEELVGDLDTAARRAQGLFKMTWWAFPSRNSRDRATGMLPRLLHERLDEIGIDVAVLYPTYGLTVTAVPDDELRRVMARAFNTYMAEAYAPHADRLIPVASIPTTTCAPSAERPSSPTWIATRVPTCFFTSQSYHRGLEHHA